MTQDALERLRARLSERLSGDGVQVRLAGNALTLVDGQLPPGTARELSLRPDGSAYHLSARDPHGGEPVEVARASDEDEAIRACVHWFDDPQ